MSGVFYTRAEIGLRQREPGPGFLTPSRVEGIALHWPAMNSEVHGVQAVKGALRGWQNYHMDDHGWSDIAYQRAYDQDGNRYQLRGLRTQSAANGNEDVNERFGALLLVLAIGEKPTDAMVRAVSNDIARFRAHFPGRQRVVGHRDIRPDGTTCPGDIVYRMIQAGEFNPRKARA